MKLVSDNGKTFKAAANLIQSIVGHENVQHYLSSLGVRWVFNLHKAPWWGGIFERLIQSTKRCLLRYSEYAGGKEKLVKKSIVVIFLTKIF